MGSDCGEQASVGKGTEVCVQHIIVLFNDTLCIYDRIYNFNHEYF